MTDLPKKLAQLLLQIRGPRGGIGGQTVTGYKCHICENEFVHPNTAAPLFCPSCERDVRALASRTESPEDWITTFSTASLSHHSIQLRKFSSTTYPADIKSQEMSEAMLAEINAKTVGRVWSARIGRQRRWHYGWTAREAVSKALAGGGVQLPAASQLERKLEELERTDPTVGAAARRLDTVKQDIIAKGRKP